MSDNKECPICTETIGDSKVITKCGHTYCYSCFMTHFCGDMSNANSCPMCRKKLFEKKPKVVKNQMNSNSNVNQSNINRNNLNLNRPPVNNPMIYIPDPIINNGNFS